MCWGWKISNLFNKKQPDNNNRINTDEEIGESDIDISSYEVSESVTPIKQSPELLPVNTNKHTTYNKEYSPYTINPNIYYNLRYIHSQLYLAEFENKIIFYYNKGRFPLKGWFQNCINCETPTGQLFLFKNYGIDNIYIRICSKCSEQFNKNPHSNINKRLIEDIKYCIECI